jgi:hypothetical protein
MIPPTHSPSASTVRRTDVARVPGSIRVNQCPVHSPCQKQRTKFEPNQERWSRVKERLRVLVRENVFFKLVCPCLCI